MQGCHLSFLESRGCLLKTDSECFFVLSCDTRTPRVVCIWVVQHIQSRDLSHVHVYMWIHVTHLSLKQGAMYNTSTARVKGIWMVSYCRRATCMEWFNREWDDSFTWCVILWHRRLLRKPQCNRRNDIFKWRINMYQHASRLIQVTHQLKSSRAPSSHPHDASTYINMRQTNAASIGGASTCVTWMSPVKHEWILTCWCVMSHMRHLHASCETPLHASCHTSVEACISHMWQCGVIYATIWTEHAETRVWMKESCHLHQDVMSQTRHIKRVKTSCYQRERHYHRNQLIIPLARENQIDLKGHQTPSLLLLDTTQSNLKRHLDPPNCPAPKPRTAGLPRRHLADDVCQCECILAEEVCQCACMSVCMYVSVPAEDVCKCACRGRM